MSNTEWNQRRPGAYSVWGEDIHPHHTFEEEEEYVEMEEEYEDVEEELSFYEEMLADSIVRDISLTDNAVRLSVSAPVSAPRLTITDGVSITFSHGDKATVTQQVIDGQLSITVQENTGLQSIKICVDNRTWTIKLDAFPVLPPPLPKKP